MYSSYPKISVVICCFRGEKTIEACLESLLVQDIPRDSFEVIIVDDGSGDKTADKIKNFFNKNHEENLENFKYFRKQNEGLSIARNFGKEKSSAELLVYIDEDVIVSKNYLRIIIEFFEKNQRVNCLGGRVDLYNDEVEFARLIQDSIFSLYMKNEESIIGANMAYRKSLLDKVGGFQPEFTYRGDETALFAKSKGVIVKGRTKLMRVKHFQPSNKIAWLKTRYENGFFSIAVDFFTNKPHTVIYLNLLKSLLFVLVPVFLSAALLATFSYPWFSLFLWGLVLILLYRKFYWNNLIPETLQELRKNRNNVTSIKEELYLIYLIINGAFKSDIGYLKGFSKFKKVIWQKT